MKLGMLYAVGAYVVWGLLPVFWKALAAVPALEILAQRMVGSLMVVLLLLALLGRGRGVVAALRNRRVLAMFVASALVLSLNWFVYIWAVNAGFIIETSLGYFINPLVSVVLGILFLRERLRRWQGVAVAIAASGVVYLTVAYGQLPWLALTLASSFAVYGLLRKTAALGSLEGLTLETLIVFVPALGYLAFLHGTGQASFGAVGRSATLLLVLSGVATATPLLLFASGARLIPLTTLGVLQYIAPTIQLVLGVVVYNEALAASRLVGFCVIWLALAVYACESIVHSRGAATLRAAPSHG